MIEHYIVRLSLSPTTYKSFNTLVKYDENCLAFYERCILSIIPDFFIL
jgi:hypothetical protein